MDYTVVSNSTSWGLGEQITIAKQAEENRTEVQEAWNQWLRFKITWTKSYLDSSSSIVKHFCI